MRTLGQACDRCKGEGGCAAGPCRPAADAATQADHDAETEIEGFGFYGFKQDGRTLTADDVTQRSTPQAGNSDAASLEAGLAQAVQTADEAIAVATGVRSTAAATAAGAAGITGVGVAPNPAALLPDDGSGLLRDKLHDWLNALALAAGLAITAAFLWSAAEDKAGMTLPMIAVAVGVAIGWAAAKAAHGGDRVVATLAVLAATVSLTLAGTARTARQLEAAALPSHQPVAIEAAVETLMRASGGFSPAVAEYLRAVEGSNQAPVDAGLESRRTAEVAAAVDRLSPAERSQVLEEATTRDHLRRLRLHALERLAARGELSEQAAFAARFDGPDLRRIDLTVADDPAGLAARADAELRSVPEADRLAILHGVPSSASGALITATLEGRLASVGVIWLAGLSLLDGLFAASGVLLAGVFGTRQ